MAASRWASRRQDASTADVHSWAVTPSNTSPWWLAVAAGWPRAAPNLQRRTSSTIIAECGLYPVYTMKLARRAGSTSAWRASSSSQLHRVNGVLMTVIDGVFWVGRACDKQTWDAFQPSRLTAVRLWAFITLQSQQWEIGHKSRSWSNVWYLLLNRRKGVTFYLYLFVCLFVWLTQKQFGTDFYDLFRRGHSQVVAGSLVVIIIRLWTGWCPFTVL